MRLLSLHDAIGEFVRDGMCVALEGFTHLIPFAAGHEIVRQRRRDLHLVRLTPDLVYDQLIGMGCASRLTFSWGGNPGVGSLHRLRDAVEHGWPHALALDEHSHADLAAANPRIGRVACPFTGEQLAAVPALNPDVTILHAQRADRAGNVAIDGIVGVQREAGLAARTLIVTVEEIVEALPPAMNAIVLPHWVVTAIAHVPGGAYPSYAHGHYARDNAFYQRWDAIARTRDGFLAWMQRHVLDTADHAGFLASLRAEAA